MYRLRLLVSAVPNSAVNLSARNAASLRSCRLARPAGEKIKETYWHNLIAWGNTATFIKNYVQKGQEIAVEGKLTNRSYDDKEGKKHYITEINVTNHVDG